MAAHGHSLGEHRPALFNIAAGADQSNQLGAGGTRPNYAPNNPALTVGNTNYPACNNTPILGGATMYYNPNCFSQQAFGTLGNFGREGLVGPGLVDVDMGLLKTTTIHEGLTLQFRAEVFNIFNHTNLSLPLSSIFSGTPSATTTLTHVLNAGQILTAAVPSREIQLGLKLIF